MKKGNKERRKHERTPFKTKCTVHVDKYHIGKCEVNDISKKGISFFVPPEIIIEKGQLVRVFVNQSEPTWENFELCRNISRNIYQTVRIAQGSEKTLIGCRLMS